MRVFAAVGESTTPTIYSENVKWFINFKNMFLETFYCPEGQ